MKYAIEMSSCAMIYIPSFINISSALQTLIEGIHRYTYREHGDRISLLFRNTESELKKSTFY
jgi:hypothetical protein